MTHDSLFEPASKVHRLHTDSNLSARRLGFIEYDHINYGS